ncbi:hypothetical protein [Pannonibacter sp. SL95]|uniref:hypothetical protein n=1 Tax=Pannonibacter sp. SL95 TaxID=2995153 RepID=UPI002274FB88|nr:hypothetical protein [Pannonibacter sp. SL95]MCY1704445.1 hypothetical protein [Pannonibacter sp. SL95]
MASSERYFGPEVVDVDEGGLLVRELKAATAFLIGTAPIHEVHVTPAARAAYINKPILIRRQSDITRHFGPVRDGYTIPQKLNAMFSKARTAGIGTICVVNVFDPAVHKDGANTPDPSRVTALDIIGTFDAAGNPSGLKLAYSCYQAYGWFPKILLATGFDGLSGVRAELGVIAGRIRARYLLDAPLGVTVQHVIEARGPSGSFDWQTSDRRAILCWPHMKVVNLDPASSTAASRLLTPIPHIWPASCCRVSWNMATTIPLRTGRLPALRRPRSRCCTFPETRRRTSRNCAVRASSRSRSVGAKGPMFPATGPLPIRPSRTCATSSMCNSLRT